MVEAKTILALLAIAVFFVAGGGALLSPAFAQAKMDFGELKSGVTEQVQNIRTRRKQARVNSLT